MASIKIYISYHRNCDRIRSEILTPIHVGRAISKDETCSLLSDMIGDDTGDNISKLNPYYCELTAQYWVWKNTSDDYVGFMHYRRHFIFNEKCKDEEDQYGLVDYQFISTDYLEQVGLDDETIRQIVLEYDIVTMTPWDVSNAGSSDNYDHYRSSSPYLHIEDYQLMLKILCKRYPEYAEDAESYGNSKFGYYTNMFVLRRDIFEDYCELLFGVLSELSTIVDLSSYSEQELRIYGYLSEWIFGIYITHLKRVGDYRIKELRRTFILHPEIHGYDVHCCSACDDNYAKHLGVLLTSVKANKGPETMCYWIMSDGISEVNKELLEKMEAADFQIRIIEQGHTKDPLLQRTLITNPHLSVAAYNKLYIPDYIPLHVNRIIYLDSDMVCRSSLLDLYDSEFNGSWVCGVKDVLHDVNCKRLNLDMYINSGMFLIDCDLWRKNCTSQMFSKYISQNINNHNAIFYQDQDVLNSVLKGHMLYVDPKWNAQTSSYEGCEEQNEIGKTATIIHFISDRKPWRINNENPFENEYGKYLALSPWSDTDRYVGETNIEKKQRLFQKCLSALTQHLFGLKPSRVVRALMTIDVRTGNLQDLNAFFDHYYPLDDKCAKFAFTFVFPFAESGNPHAMVRVARAYKDGHGVDRDLRKSFEWFKRTEESGVDWVMDEFAANIPDIYDESYSYDDPAYNRVLFETMLRFAESGNPHAMVRVARAYKDGHGVDRDLRKSFEWFKRTEESGVDWVMDEFAANIPAMYDESYSHDDPAYNRVLLETMLRFAESGNPHAMVRVARAYKDGHGVDMDLKKTVEWINKIKEPGQKHICSNDFK